MDMEYTSLTSLSAKNRDVLYDAKNSGVLIVRDSFIVEQKTLTLLAGCSWILKDHQEINNGQEHFVPTIGDIALQQKIRKFLEKAADIKKILIDGDSTGIIEYGFTRYPVSTQGALYHKDFSKNKNCIVTFFFGPTTFCVADNKTGLYERRYEIQPGDILLMRGPRDDSEREKALRPIHKIGKVPQILYTLEIREID